MKITGTTPTAAVRPYLTAPRTSVTTANGTNYLTVVNPSGNEFFQLK